MSGVAINNLLLASAPADAMASLRERLEPVELGRRDGLAAPGRPLSHVYFPLSGVASIVARFGERPIEVGLFGYEGMSGISLLFGVDRPIYETFMQIPGSALRIEVAPFLAALETYPALKAHLLQFTYLLHLQSSETAAANALASLEQRLARWLLLCRDRLPGSDIEITHDFLAVMLGVRRPTVTLTVQAIEGAGLVRATRGKIEIRDRDKLLQVAGASYGAAAAAYRKFFGGANAASSAGVGGHVGAGIIVERSPVTVS